MPRIVGAREAVTTIVVSQKTLRTATVIGGIEGTAELRLQCGHSQTTDKFLEDFVGSIIVCDQCSQEKQRVGAKAWAESRMPTKAAHGT
jgi:hypothetical protein